MRARKYLFICQFIYSYLHQVLIERSQSTIARATAGIAFLGTPFRGTHDKFHEELPKMAEANNISNVNDKILHYLRKDNSTLEDLVDAFLDMRMRSSGSDMPRVVCFFECLETRVNKIVNDPQPLKVNTLSMNRYY
jgi:hypothetical protein